MSAGIGFDFGRVSQWLLRGAAKHRDRLKPNVSSWNSDIAFAVWYWVFNIKERHVLRNGKTYFETAENKKKVGFSPFEKGNGLYEEWWQLNNRTGAVTGANSERAAAGLNASVLVEASPISSSMATVVRRSVPEGQTVNQR